MKCYVLDLGKAKYQPVWDLQKQLADARARGAIPDIVILVEHEPVITFGKNDKWNKLNVPVNKLFEIGVDFFQVERGGGATYHGPGQLVGYPIIDLRKKGMKLWDYLVNLEETALRTARQFGAPVERQEHLNPTTEKPYRSIWYINEGKKHILCTKGIAVILNRVTYHGFAFYVNKEIDHFNLIDPCGFKKEDATPISLEEIIGKKIDFNDFKHKWLNQFADVFDYELERVTLKQVEQLLDSTKAI